MEDSVSKKDTNLNISNYKNNIFSKYIFPNNSNNKNNSSINKLDENSFSYTAPKDFLSQNIININNNKNIKLYSLLNNKNLSDQTQNTNLQINRNDLSVFNKSTNNNYIEENLNNGNSATNNLLIKLPESSNNNNDINAQNKSSNILGNKLTFNKNSSSNYIINSDNTNLTCKSPENSDNKNHFNFNLNLNSNSNSNNKTLTQQNISLLSPIEKEQSENFINDQNIISKETNLINNPNERDFLYKYSELFNGKNNSNSSTPKININNNNCENETFTYKDYYQGKIKFIFRDNANFFSELTKKFQSQNNVIEEYENWLALLLNILSQTRYQSQLRNVELVKFVI